MKAEAEIKSYRDRVAWQKAMELVEQVYGLARSLPPEERFGLVAQMQRAAISIPANIAEGQGRKHRKEFVNHLSIARGSLMETETYLLLLGRLGFVSKEGLQGIWHLSQDVGRLLNGLLRALQRAPARQLAVGRLPLATGH